MLEGTSERQVKWQVPFPVGLDWERETPMSRIYYSEAQNLESVGLQRLLAGGSS